MPGGKRLSRNGHRQDIDHQVAASGNDIDDIFLRGRQGAGPAGGYIMEFFGAEGVTGFNFYSLLVAILGAVVLLWVVGLFSRKR